MIESFGKFNRNQLINKFKKENAEPPHFKLPQFFNFFKAGGNIFPHFSKTLYSNDFFEYALQKKLVKKEDLETEVSLLWDENAGLEKKVRSLEEDVKENSYLKFEIQRQKLNLGKYCKKCSKNT